MEYITVGEFVDLTTNRMYYQDLNSDVSVVAWAKFPRRPLGFHQALKIQEP